MIECLLTFIRNRGINIIITLIVKGVISNVESVVIDDSMQCEQQVFSCATDLKRNNNYSYIIYYNKT